MAEEFRRSKGDRKGVFWFFSSTQKGREAGYLSLMICREFFRKITVLFGPLIEVLNQVNCRI